MNLLLLILLSTVPIDGYRLAAKSAASSPGKEYNKAVTTARDRALIAAWDIAGTGAFELRWCPTTSGSPVTGPAFRLDVIKALNRVIGVYATPDENGNCVNLSWKQP